MRGTISPPFLLPGKESVRQRVVIVAKSEVACVGPLVKRYRVGFLGASGCGDSRAHVPAGLSAVCMPVCVSQRAVIFLGFSLAVVSGIGWVQPRSRVAGVWRSALWAAGT